MKRILLVTILLSAMVIGIHAENKKEVFQLNEKGCAQGSAKNCAYLGIMYENGLGIKKNNRKALQAYKKSCNNGDAEGCAYLGSMYEEGKSVKKDYRKAVQLYKIGCNSGYGCSDLGRMYLHGYGGVGVDYLKASNLFKKSCKLEGIGCEMYKYLNKKQ